MIKIELWINGEMEMEQYCHRDYGNSKNRIQSVVDRIKIRYKFVLKKSDWAIYIAEPSKMNTKTLNIAA